MMAEGLFETEAVGRTTRLVDSARPGGRRTAGEPDRAQVRYAHDHAPVGDLPATAILTLRPTAIIGVARGRRRSFTARGAAEDHGGDQRAALRSCLRCPIRPRRWECSAEEAYRHTGGRGAVPRVRQPVRSGATPTARPSCRACATNSYIFPGVGRSARSRADRDW